MWSSHHVSYQSRHLQSSSTNMDTASARGSHSTLTMTHTLSSQPEGTMLMSPWTAPWPSEPPQTMASVWPSRSLRSASVRSRLKFTTLSLRRARLGWVCSSVLFSWCVWGLTFSHSGTYLHRDKVCGKGYIKHLKYHYLSLAWSTVVLIVTPESPIGRAPNWSP